jgi:hypothetical protein
MQTASAWYKAAVPEQIATPGEEAQPGSRPRPEQLRPDGERWDMRSIYAATNAQRRVIMDNGVMPDLEGLAGWEFAGTNTGPWAALIRSRKFKKGFYRGPDRHPGGPTPFVQGYNIPVKQNGVGAPHVAKPTDEAPKRFGFYRVHRVVPGAKDSLYEDCALLDYSLGGNAWYDPGRLLRDYLVQVYPDDPDLLLGHAFGALFGLRIQVSFFILERMNRHDFTGE